MKLTKHIFIGFALMSGLIACNKSPSQIYRELTSTKVKGHHVAENGNESELASEDPHQQSIAEPSSIEQVVESIPKAGSDKMLVMCHALIKTMVTEPYFYQFQANLRDYRTRDDHGSLVKGHVRYHRLDSLKSKTM